MGVTNKVPDPPEVLVLLRQCRELGLPLVEGGLIDQPHLWLLEIGVVKEVEELFDIINQKPTPEGNNNAQTKPI